jgi:hypothetical protein
MWKTVFDLMNAIPEVPSCALVVNDWSFEQTTRGGLSSES